MKHSIHCAGYRGPGKGFDIASCDCRHTLGVLDLQRERDACAYRDAEVRIAKAVAIILDGLPDWDAEAQQNAQSQQTPEAWTQTMAKKLGDVLKEMVSK